jgi:predicted GIY-YIG superfamily endonuclease
MSMHYTGYKLTVVGNSLTFPPGGKGRIMAQGNRRDRDTYRYVLRDGRDIVMYGVTDDPDTRLDEHRRNHRKPNLSMTVESPAVTRESALARERAMIEQYCRNHGGERPRYNKV